MQEDITFTWKIGEDEKYIIKENFSRDNYIEEIIAYGSIAEEISLTCMAVLHNEGSRLFEFEPIRILEDVGEKNEVPFILSLKDIIWSYSDYKYKLKKGINKSCFNFYLLEKIVKIFVLSECKDTSESLYSKSVNINENNNIIIKKINEIFMLSIKKDKVNKDYGLKKFKELIAEIIKNHKIYKETLEKKDKGKCIALYRKRHSQEITIAFSGFLDLECGAIKSLKGVKKNNLSHYEKIAQVIGAKLAKLDCSVSRYRFDNRQVERYCSLKEIIENKYDISNEKHSCCERKIFTYLEDQDEKVYSGKLFVKYSPCEECKAAIFYHVLDKGKEFSMEIGLPNL